MVTVTTFTEAGGHPSNEDSFRTFVHQVDPACLVCVLADGQGGRAGGAEASALACETALAGALRWTPKTLSSDFITWRDALRYSDVAVAKDPRAGFTTLLGFSVWNGYLAGASCGDSAVLAVAGGNAVEVTALQLKNPPVGSGAAVFVPFRLKLVEPWKVLAMSDGVWKYAGWQRVVQAATNLRGEPLVDALREAARLPGSGLYQDDFTVVAFESS
jgi:serine/threonine protein phosphatase PrpC